MIKYCVKSSILKSQLKQFIGSVCVFLLVGVAYAEDKTDSFFSIQFENDTFVASNQDRYYTSGIQLTLLKKEEPPAWLKTISQWTPFYKKGQWVDLVQYTVGQKMFTPDDITSSTLQLTDRPYAGYLYVGVSAMSQIKREENTNYGNKFEITLGVVGPSALGEQVQTFVHRQVGSDKPNGWSHQLKDELALGLNYSRFMRVIKPMYFGLDLGMNSQLSGALGNVYTFGAAGVMFRLGKHLNHDFSPPNIRPGFPGLTYFQSKNKTSWYFYLGLEARAMLRNIFLDGNSFQDSHSVEKEPFVGDFQYGIVFILGDVRIAYSNMIRTKEFNTQVADSNYGLLNVSFVF